MVSMESNLDYWGILDMLGYKCRSITKKNKVFKKNNLISGLISTDVTSSKKYK